MMGPFQGVPLWHRLALAQKTLAPVQTDYRVVFEESLDEPACVMVADPNWMACALEGGILPPVEVYHRLEQDESGRVRNGHILHDTPPIGPMSEEEAIEYLIRKDVPAHVWQASGGNSRKFVICKKDQLPSTRTWRNAWRIKQENEQ